MVQAHVLHYFTGLAVVDFGGTALSVRNRASPSDNDWLKLLRTDWFGNLSDKFTLEQIVKRTVQSKKSQFGLTGFKTYFEHCALCNVDIGLFSYLYDVVFIMDEANMLDELFEF